MRTIHRNQAEIEARDVSEQIDAAVSVYKLPDGRYEVEHGSDFERGNSLIARYRSGRQEI